MTSKVEEILKRVNKKAGEDILTSGLKDYEYERIPFTSPRLNYCTFGGIPVGKITEFFGEEHGGKALALDCKILTPRGYVEMRDIEVGNVVIDGNGKTTTVVGVYPQGVRDMYRLTLSDNTTVECSDEHLWSVYKHKKTGEKSELQTISLKEMLDTYKDTTKKNFFYYSLPTPIITDIDTSHSTITDLYMLGVVYDTVNKVPKCLYSDHSSIPKECLYTSVENRTKLLQGLFDLNGKITKKHGMTYCTSSPEHSKDFAFLVRSLGGIDRIRVKNDSYIHTITFDNGIVPFTSKKHSDKYALIKNNHERKIVNIEKIENAECQCIKVASDCHTFIVENEIVTHNTTTALDIVANYQRMPNARKVLYVDAENTLDVQWAKKLGVKVDEMYILQPQAQSAEEIFQIVLDMIETGEIGLWILDSIGVLVSKQEFEKTIEEKTYCGISSPLSSFSKKAEQIMRKHESTGIGINQLRENLNSQHGGKKTPGGLAWKHCCSVRIQFSRGKFFDDKGNELNNNAENPCGNYVVMSMAKNKTCPMIRRVGFYTLNYYTGIDYLADLIDVAIKYNLVSKAGAWYSVLNADGEVISDKVQGQNKLRELLETDEKLRAEVERTIEEKIEEEKQKLF